METTSFQRGGYEGSLRMQTMSTAPQENTESQYKPGNLGGNWFNERAVAAPPTERWATVYGSSYKPYEGKASNRDNFPTWEGISQGSDTRSASDHSGKKYFGNLATTYGQTHRPPKPKRLSGSHYGDRIPLQNVANSDLNLTGYGLIDSMKCKWFAQTGDNRPWQTTYQMQFLKPDAKVAMGAGAMKPTAQYRLEQVLRHMGSKTYYPEPDSRIQALSNRPLYGEVKQPRTENPIPASDNATDEKKGDGSHNVKSNEQQS